MFTLGSGGPNDNDNYTNPALQYSTAYTYFVICLPDTTPETLNVRVLQLYHWYCLTMLLLFCCCLFVSQDPPALRVTNYALAGFSSFGSEYTTPAGEGAHLLPGWPDSSVFVCSNLTLALPFPPLSFHCSLSCSAPTETVDIGPITGGVVVALVLVAIIGIAIIIVVIM